MLDRLDAIVIEYGGRVYLGKDAGLPARANKCILDGNSGRNKGSLGPESHVSIGPRSPIGSFGAQHDRINTRCNIPIAFQVAHRQLRKGIQSY